MKSSETSRDLNGYLEPLTHLCTVLNIANESCFRIIILIIIIIIIIIIVTDYVAQFPYAYATAQTFLQLVRI